MLRISHRFVVGLFVLVVLGSSSVALANHSHIGGGSSGGGSSDPDADCLVWGYVFADGGGPDGADADAAGMSDGADAAQPMDAGTDGGPPAGAALVCLEHAKLFGCDCAVGPEAGDGWARGAVALLAAALLGVRRRRRAASPGGTR
jgi:MYXO-CTERM domain-containing protein